MQQLINKLSKTDKRHVHLALAHATNGNTRMLDSLVRSANKRSAPILEAIQNAFNNGECL